jgi:hypothetical protein
MALIRPGLRIDQGAFSLRGLVRHLRTLLPKDFADLQHPLGVGVFETSSRNAYHDVNGTALRGKFELITSGDLAEAVAASCAIPYIFQPIFTGSPPRYFADGGFVDRSGVSAWHAWVSGSGDGCGGGAIGAPFGSPARSGADAPGSSIPKHRAIVHLVDSRMKDEDTFDPQRSAGSLCWSPRLPGRCMYVYVCIYLTAHRALLCIFTQKVKYTREHCQGLCC